MREKINMKNKRLILWAVVALAGFLPQSQAAVVLGSADSFAVLGGSAVSSTGNTDVNGNLGVSPGTSITGFPPGTVTGTQFSGAGSAAGPAHTDAAAAYTALAGETSGSDLTGQNLGGLTLTPGVYRFGTLADLTGMLTLNALGNPNARFDFLIGSALTTASSSSVVLLNGAQANNVYWQIGTSATLGVDSSFAGSVLADQSITLQTRASLSGRALAINGAVTLDSNAITVLTAVPEPAAFGSLALGISVFGGYLSLAARRRRPDSRKNGEAEPRQ
jgi:hypothetical protein